MLTTIFQLRDPTTKLMQGPAVGFESTFKVPTLSAYAATSLVIHLGALSAAIPLDCIDGDQLTIEAGYSADDLGCSLIVHYIGIRDYALLFPGIQDESLRKRLGELFAELESCFASKSWLSFMLMTGAVLEGFLHWKTQSSGGTLKHLIDKARSQNLITDRDKTLLHTVRKYRNLVHASLHNESYVERQHAMDARVLIERLIRAG